MERQKPQAGELHSPVPPSQRSARRSLTSQRAEILQRRARKPRNRAQLKQKAWDRGPARIIRSSCAASFTRSLCLTVCGSSFLPVSIGAHGLYSKAPFPARAPFPFVYFPPQRLAGSKQCSSNTNVPVDPPGKLVTMLQGRIYLFYFASPCFCSSEGQVCIHNGLPWGTLPLCLNLNLSALGSGDILTQFSCEWPQDRRNQHIPSLKLIIPEIFARLMVFLLYFLPPHHFYIKKLASRPQGDFETLVYHLLCQLSE